MTPLPRQVCQQTARCRVGIFGNVGVRSFVSGASNHRVRLHWRSEGQTPRASLSSGQGEKPGGCVGTRGSRSPHGAKLIASTRRRMYVREPNAWTAHVLDLHWRLASRQPEFTPQTNKTGLRLRGRPCMSGATAPLCLLHRALMRVNDAGGIGAARRAIHRTIQQCAIDSERHLRECGCPGGLSPEVCPGGPGPGGPEVRRSGGPEVHAI